MIHVTLASEGGGPHDHAFAYESSTNVRSAHRVVPRHAAQESIVVVVASPARGAQRAARLYGCCDPLVTSLGTFCSTTLHGAAASNIQAVCRRYAGGLHAGWTRFAGGLRAGCAACLVECQRARLGKDLLGYTPLLGYTALLSCWPGQRRG